MLARRVLPLLVAPVALAVGCGSGGGELVVEATPAGVQSASQATLDAETASVEISLSMSPSSMGLPVAGDSFTLAGGGVIDFVNQRSEMSFDLGDLGAVVGDQAGDAGGAFDQPVRAIQDGTRSYLCFALFQMLAGGECVTIDAGEQVDTPLGDNFLTGGGIDPQAFLASLRGASEVEAVGEEEVVGVNTQRFHGAFSVAQALEDLDPAAAAEVQAAFARVGAAAEFADTSHAFDVWVDDDGRIRQVRLELDLGAVAGEGAAPVVIEIRYLEFGVPVQIDVPADAVDISELTGLLGG